MISAQAKPSASRQALAWHLNQAHKLIGSQLDLRNCDSQGMPMLEEPRCHRCQQLSACNWRHASDDTATQQTANGEDPLSRQTWQHMTRDFFLALMLIEEYQNCHTFPPAMRDAAQQWLTSAQQLRKSLIPEPHHDAPNAERAASKLPPSPQHADIFARSRL